MAGPSNFKDNRPAHLLAKLMNEELETHINPAALRLFIKANWERVHVLAHAIHEGKK